MLADVSQGDPPGSWLRHLPIRRADPVLNLDSSDLCRTRTEPADRLHQVRIKLDLRTRARNRLDLRLSARARERPDPLARRLSSRRVVEGIDVDAFGVGALGRQRRAHGVDHRGRTGRVDIETGEPRDAADHRFMH